MAKSKKWVKGDAGKGQKKAPPAADKGKTSEKKDAAPRKEKWYGKG